MKTKLFQKIGKTISILSLLTVLGSTPTMASPLFGSESKYVCSQPNAYGQLVDVYEVKTYAFGVEISSKMVFKMHEE